MFKCVNDSPPMPVVGYFTIDANIHSYTTRQTLHFYPPNVRSDLGKNNITYRGTKMWNSLLDLGIDSETSVFLQRM